MRKCNGLSIWFAAFLLLMVTAGCSDPDKTEGVPGLTAPRVIGSTPLDGATLVCPNLPLTATFSEAMTPATINSSTFTLTGPGSTAVAGQVTYSSANKTATFTPTVPLVVLTTYTATLTTGVKDEFGNALTKNLVWTFTTAASPCVAVGSPRVIATTPGNGACPNTAATALFSEAMDPATINNTTFAMVGPGNAPVVGTVTYDAVSGTAIFTPSGALALNTLYAATITTGATDLTGDPLAADFTWSFTTSATPCMGPAPTVIASTPADGTCPNTIVTATFSGPMNPATFDNTTFTVTGPGNTPVAGTVSYDTINDQAVFVPSATLGVSTLYTATITTGVSDLSGSALAADFVWTFTTGPVVCSPPAPPIAVTPTNGVIDACQSTIVTAVFPQAMDPLTINTTTFTMAGPGVTPVAGTISHDVTNRIFSFTPSADLVLLTTYTATITTGATDTMGSALASNYVWTFETAAAPCAGPLPPAVISVSPPNEFIPGPPPPGVCPNTLVMATFNEAMDPTTINTTTITLAGPGVTPVLGTVALDGTGRVAVFTPSAALAVSTLHTATVTTGAKDPLGNAIAANYIWSFTTSAAACSAPVPLRSAGNFEALAGSTITNTGPTTITGGDLGLSPGSAVTGFPPGTVVPPATLHVTDPAAAQAALDLTAAYNFAAGVLGAAVLPGDLSGLTFTPGVYKNSSTVMLSSGAVTLDGGGDSNSVFIFQISSTLTTLAGTQVILSGGTQAKNVFWQVSTSATLGTNSIFEGNILALDSITMDTGAVLTGRVLARNAAVTMDSNTITVP